MSAPRAWRDVLETVAAGNTEPDALAAMARDALTPCRTVDTDTATAAAAGDALAAVLGLARIRTGPDRGRYRLPSGDVAAPAALARTVAAIVAPHI
jgi:hypothetical protein